MIYVFLANGFEETEAIAAIDVLRRSEKNVVTVGIGEEVVTSSHGITVVTDITEVDAVLTDELEMIVDKSFWPVPTYGDLLFEV